MPFLGLPIAIPAFICGIVALKKRRNAATYGAVTSDIRAVVGLVFSIIGILVWGGLLIFGLIAHLMN
jgi:hypothetical protein